MGVLLREKLGGYSMVSYMYGKYQQISLILSFFIFKGHLADPAEPENCMVHVSIIE